MFGVGAACAVAFLTSHVPFRNLLRLNVVVYGMTPVAKRTRGSLHVVGWVERCPPISPVFDEVFPPFLMGHIPLRWVNEVVIADFLEIALLPLAAISQRHVFLG